MNVLFWLSIELNQHATSRHLIIAMISAVCKEGHSVHIIQKATDGCLPSIPKELELYDITMDAISFKNANKGNFIARYMNELKYIYNCAEIIQPIYDAIFVQSTTVGGFVLKFIRKKCLVLL